MAPAPAGMMAGKAQQGPRNQEATIYVGNLDEKVTEAVLRELMIQMGPVVYVHIPRDRITQQHQGYGFVEFQGEEDAEYAIKILSGVKLYNKPLKINKSSTDKRTLDVGANLFIGSLSPEVDEKILLDTFTMFGTLIQTPKVARDEATGVSRGFGFISYDSFEASDAAIEAMNGQFLCNRPITVNYAYKKDGKGERHGSAAERLLAAQSKRATAFANNMSAGPSSVPTPISMPIPMPMGGYGSARASIPNMAVGTMQPMANPLMPQAHVQPVPIYPGSISSSMYYSSAYPTSPQDPQQQSINSNMMYHLQPQQNLIYQQYPLPQQPGQQQQFYNYNHSAPQ